MNVKQFTVGTLFALVLLTVAFSPISTQQSGSYDPWIDTNDDGIIDIYDLIAVGVRFGAEGIPINKTVLLLELEARIDVLNATVMALEGTKHYAGTEVKITIGNQIDITFPVGVFSEPPQLSVVVYAMNGRHAGKTCYIQSMSVGTASATLDLQAWNGVTYVDLDDGDSVQVSYTAVQTP